MRSPEPRTATRIGSCARPGRAMAVRSIRRRILNQHVMLEAGALAGIAGGLIGLIFQPAGYPTAAFFAVSVPVATYHLFSEWLSLLVKTRSSQAVKRLLELQPDTANLVRDGETRCPSPRSRWATWCACVPASACRWTGGYRPGARLSTIPGHRRARPRRQARGR